MNKHLRVIIWFVVSYGIMLYFTIFLVGGLEHLLFSHILGISSSQLTNIFQRGSNHQTDIFLYLIIIFVVAWQVLQVTFRPLGFAWHAAPARGSTARPVASFQVVSAGLQDLSIYISISIYIYLYLYLSISIYIDLSIYLPIYPSISLCLCVCLCLSLFYLILSYLSSYIYLVTSIYTYLSMICKDCELSKKYVE